MSMNPDANIRRMATVVRDSNDAITIQDFEGNITAWNRGAAQMYGYSEEEALQMNIDLLTPPGKLAEQRDFIRRLIAGETITSFETQRLTKNGRVLDVWLTVTKLMDDDGKPVGLASTERDITTRKRAVEEMVVASEIRYRRLFETAKDGILILDAETGMIVDVNPFLIKLLGFSHEQFLGKKVWELGFFKDIVANQANFAELQQKEYMRYENKPLQTSDGRQVEVEFISNVYLIGKKKVIQCNVRDISERKQIERQLASAMATVQRSNKDLEQFAYVASHDLQEPLRMVSSYTQLLAERYGDQLDEKAKKYIDYAVDGAIRMQRLINDLLTYSRINTQGVIPKLTDSHSVLGEALRNLSAAIEENRAIVTNDDLPVVRADASQLMQVFQNLISNAIKFRRADDAPRIHVSVKNLGHEWCFSVKDNGIGIDSKYAGKVFVIFQRLHTSQEYPGTGIGLAMCKRVVERHGGRIWFESELDKGSTFYFTLPK